MRPALGGMRRGGITYRGGNGGALSSAKKRKAPANAFELIGPLVF